MSKYITVLLVVGAAFAGGEYGRENLKSETRGALKLTVEHSQNVLVSEENIIIDELRKIYLNNRGNSVRAGKLAKYLNENNFCEIHNGWNVLIIDDAWYDRQTFCITEQSTKFLAVKTHGFGYPEEIYVIFNECQVAEATTTPMATRTPIPNAPPTDPITSVTPPPITTTTTAPPKIPTMSNKVKYIANSNG